MRHTRRRQHAPSGIACVAACTSCAADVIPGAEQYEPGRHLAIIHIGHVAELEQRGWTVVHDMYGEPGTDVICAHIAPELRPWPPPED